MPAETCQPPEPYVFRRAITTFVEEAREDEVVRRTSRTVGVLFALLCAAGARPAIAQDGVPTRLSLQEAIGIATERNPVYARARNSASLAEWGEREAWGNLLPTASASLGGSWEGAGEQRLGSLTASDLGITAQPSYYFSNYNLGIGYALDWASLKQPARARAEREATQARIELARADLVALVTGAYIDVLRQRELLRVAERQLESARLNLRLAEGQLAVGSVTPIDVGQAEVQVGRAEVRVLQSETAAGTARTRLLQQMGVPLSQRVDAATELELTEPSWTFDELWARAAAENPALEAVRSDYVSAETGVSAARSPYLPTLSINTGWSGFTRQAGDADLLVRQAQAQVASTIRQCVSTNELYQRLADPLPPIDCTRFAFTDEQRRAILQENNRFPLDFQSLPPSLSIGLSIPLFQGFGRERNLEAARVQRDDAAEVVREQELALEADLSIGLANVRAAYESALLEERNRALAERQLTLARERYQVGAITFVELTEAQALLTQAEGDRAVAIYAYHDAVTDLESIVGTPLRN